jgi:hypothetical protein
MAYLICPECGAHNPLEEEQCRICQASLAGVEPVDEAPSPEEPAADQNPFEAEDQDLSDLLQGLKLDDDYEIDPQGLPEIHLDDAGEAAQDQTPEWLDAVRKRAQEEEDSVGDLIRRVESAQESVASEGKGQHNDFESWLQKLRDEARDKAAGSAPAPEPPEESPDETPETPEPAEPAPEPEADDQEDSDWLARIRKAHGIVDPEEGPNAASRSLLDWLVALEDNPPEEEEENDLSAETQQIATGFEKLPMDITQQIRVALEPKVTPQALNLSREEREQADLLSTIINDEKADHPTARRSYKVGVQWVNLLFLLALVVGISLALFSGGTASLAQPQPSAGAAALVAWIEDLPEDPSLLLVFDYQPAYASEMAQMAAPILTGLAERGAAMAVASSAASGPLLADDLLAGVGDGLAYTDIGYYPMASYGAYGMATGLSTGATAPGLPEPAEGLLAADYDGLLILSDNFEGAQTWIEQLSARSPETPLGVLVTSQAAPLLQPYFDSGQVVGGVSGFSDAVALTGETGDSAEVLPRWRAYQVGGLILIAALLLGAVFTPTGKPSPGKRGGR